MPSSPGPYVADAPEAITTGLRYEIGVEIGRGGMARVHLGRVVGAEGVEQACAIKRVLPGLLGDRRSIEMFCDEARIAALLRHQNTVDVVDFVLHEGEPLLVLEYVHGVSLGEVTRKAAAVGSRFPLGAALYVATQMLCALGAAHDARDESGRPLGVVHRDVSPGNVLIDVAGHVKLTDFGIVQSEGARRSSSGPELTGKLGYMSPEQVAGEPLTRRSDLFVVGTNLAEMITGRALFTGRDELEVLTRNYEADLSELARSASCRLPELLEILRTALAREPESRFGDAGELERAILEFARCYDVLVDESGLLPWLARLRALPGSGTFRVAPRAPERRPALLDEIARIRAQLGSRGHPVSPPPAVGPFRDEAPMPTARFWATEARLESVPFTRLVELAATGRVLPDCVVSVPTRGFCIAREAFAFLDDPAYRMRDAAREHARWRRPLVRAELPSVLFALAAARSTGMLAVVDAERQKRLFLLRGTITFTSSTDRSELIGERLHEQGLASERQIAEAVLHACEVGCRLGQSLVSLGTVTPVTVLRALVAQMEHRILDLGTWAQGELVYVPAARAGITVPRPICSAGALVARLVATHYGPREIAAVLEPFARERVRPVVAPRLYPGSLGLPPGQAAALRGISGELTLDENVRLLADGGLAAREDALSAVFIGLSAGLLESPGWCGPAIHGSSG